MVAKNLADHAFMLRNGLGFEPYKLFAKNFAKFFASFAAIYLLILDRTSWKTNMLTVLLAPYRFLSLPAVLFSFLRVPSTGVKGDIFLVAGCIQLFGFCTFEACVGTFWSSIMKMRSQYTPEEAGSTIMNFFHITLNIFVCVVLYNVNAFPITVMFGMCCIFLFMAAIYAVYHDPKRLKAIADRVH